MRMEQSKVISYRGKNKDKKPWSTSVGEDIMSEENDISKGYYSSNSRRKTISNSLDTWLTYYGIWDAK